MSSIDYKPVNILLVEDDDVDAMGIERAIRKMRMANPLIRAVDGVEALELLKRAEINRPYIILLDLNLPRMGGLDLLKTIREDDSLKDAIVFVLTTSKTEEEICSAYRLNVAGYIVKSSLSQDFSQVLEFLDHYWRLVEVPS
ncbi:response regulator [Devosia sp.]|uniref:response regulator n=1 Tax=Devosia sp. TaxID=1871048 RepID=UPI003A8CD32C